MKIFINLSFLLLGYYSNPFVLLRCFRSDKVRRRQKIWNARWQQQYARFVKLMSWPSHSE